MGSDGYARYVREPCANCGKFDGIMGSSAWPNLTDYGGGRSLLVCSRACGERLNAKVGAGMVPDPFPDYTQERVADLRTEIKRLRSLLRRATQTTGAGNDR